jgi:hypothetical protein
MDSKVNKSMVSKVNKSTDSKVNKSTDSKVNKSGYLSKRGYVLRKADYTDEQLLNIKLELRGRPLTDNKFASSSNTDTTYPIYLDTKTKLYIPKMYGIQKFGFPEIVTEYFEGKEWEHPIEFKGTLYDRQIEPVNTLINNCNEKFGGILTLPTGFGKTISLLYVLSKLKGKTIIIVNKIPLMNQWISEINKFLPDAKVGIIQGQKNVDVNDCDIVVAMLQSMARIDYPDELFRDFRITVCDECFPYETNIITSHGNMNIGTLYYMKERGEDLPMVKTFNEEKKIFELKKIVNVFKKCNDNLIEIQCSKMKIRSTNNHKYLTHNGWKEAKDITLNDYLVSHYDKNTINSVCPGLNSDQYQIILGSFLGDGHIQHLNNGRYRLSIRHGKQQSDYCKWKASIFNIDNITIIKENGYSKKEACSFTTKTFYLFNKLPNTKTYVPQWILDELDERGLAIWFMDDGSINKNAFNARLSTDSFDEDSQKRIVLKLKSMNIDCKYTKYKKEYFNIMINENGTKQLIKLLSKYVHKDLLYKLMTREYIAYLHDTSVNEINTGKIFYKKENIDDKLLIENKIYQIYKTYSKKEISYVKYMFCNICNTNTFHNQTICKSKYKYYKCYHIKSTKLDLPTEFSSYIWNNKFLDYGYSKVTKIITNIKNYNKSKFKQNYVFDMEIEDNHNYIVSNNKHISTNNDIYNGFVVHNCHNTASKVFSQILFKLCCKYTIGLSATPKRSDGCEYVFKWHLGDIVYETKSERKGKPPIIRYLKIDSKDYKEITTENKFTGQKQIQFTSMLSDLVDMTKRNGLIVDLIKDLIKKDNGRKLLVLSDRRTHLQTIQSLLDGDLEITFTYGLFLGGMKQKDLEKGRACQVILATYQAFGEGVSEKDLDTLLLITPKKFIGHLKNTTKNESGKLEQIVGRIFRKEHIERNPLIIDFYDNFSVYKSQAAQRKNFYKQHFNNSINEEWSINLDDVNKGNGKLIDSTSYISFIKIKKKKEAVDNKNLSNSIMQYCILDD